MTPPGDTLLQDATEKFCRAAACVVDDWEKRPRRVPQRQAARHLTRP